MLKIKIMAKNKPQWIDDLSLFEGCDKDGLPHITLTKPHDEKSLKTLMEMSDLEISELYKDYSLCGISYSYNDILSFLTGNYIEEAFFRTYPIETTKNYIETHFNIPTTIKNVVITKNNGVEKLNIFACNILNNLYQINQAMNACGYFLGIPKSLEEIKEGEWIWLQYEPRHEEDFSKNLRQETNVLYHFTPKEKLDKIFRQGFIPKDSNEFFNYPSRIYFFKGTIHHSQMLNMCFNIGQSAIRKEYKKEKELKSQGKEDLNPYSHSRTLTKDYALLTVKLDKVPPKVRFYPDPNATDCVYTTDVIYSAAIIKTDDYQIDLNNNSIIKIEE